MKGSFITGLLATGAFSHDIRVEGRSSDGESVELVATAFSGRFSHADMRLLYRRSREDDWLSDAILESAGTTVDGNILRGAICSPWGAETRFRWNHLANGVSFGTECQIALEITASPTIHSYIGGHGWSESVSGDGRIIETETDYRVAGRDSSGNILALSDDEFILMRSDTRVLMRVGGMMYPQHAQETESGYIILDTWNSRIVEIDSDGTMVQEVDISGYVGQAVHFAYDSITQRILIPGGSIHMVHELTWAPGDYGRLLWSHGNILEGNGVSELSHPSGVAYDQEDRDKVLIADSGNNRVVIIDRSPPAQTISTLSQVNFLNGTSVSMAHPFRVFASGDTILVAERSGERELFSTSRTEHPALARAFAAQGGAIVGKNQMPQYRNLVFAPILRGE